MTRNEKILYRLNPKGKGLEIGPSYNPVAPKNRGYNVKVLDHATRADLMKKYECHGVDVSKIEEVDYIWHGEKSLSSVVGGDELYDWIIACHVIEHVPDLISFLNSCAELLGAAGILSLAIPDKRYCFDFFREKSSLSQVIDAHTEHRQRHTVGMAAEYFLNAVSKGGLSAWGLGHYGEFKLAYDAEFVKSQMVSFKEASAYLDCHAWVFTPWSFRLLMSDLYSLGLIPLREVAFFDTSGCEFYVALGRDGRGSEVSRLDMAKLNSFDQ